MTENCDEAEEISMFELAVFAGDDRMLETALRCAATGETVVTVRDLEFLADRVSGRYRKSRGRPADSVGDAFVRRERTPIDQTAVATYFATRALAQLRKQFGSRNKILLSDGRRVSILNLAANVGVRRWEVAREGRFSKVSASRVYELLRRSADRRRHLIHEYMKFCAQKFQH